jgi:hypothetical protein
MKSYGRKNRAKRYRLTCLYCWLSIEQSISFRALDQAHHALPIVYLAVVPHKRPLVEVAVQVLLARLVLDSVMGA